MLDQTRLPYLDISPPSLLQTNATQSFSFVSIFVSSRIMVVTAGYFALAATSFVGFDLNQNGLIAFALVGQFLIFSAGTYGYSIYTRKELTLYEAWSIFPVLLLFYSAEYYFVEQILPGSAPWISLFFAFIILCLYLLTKTWLLKASLNSETMIYAYIAIVVFHTVYLELMPNFLKPWLFVAIIFAGALRLRLLGLPKGYTKHLMPILIIIGILVIEYYWIISTVFYNPTANSFLVCFSAYFSLGWLYQTLCKFDKYRGLFYLLNLAHLLAIAGLYQLTDPYGSFAVSLAWLIYAGIIITYSFIDKDKLLAKSVLTILALAAGKALLYDAASTANIVRILCLMLTGAVLYGAGLIMKKIEGWTK